MNYQEMRKARKARKATQEQLAQLLGVNRATISKYETGAIEPSVQQLLTICGFLGVSLETLAGNTVSDAYEEGIITGSQAEEWENRNIVEFWKQEYGYSGSDTEAQLISAFSRLNETGQHEAVKRVEELTEIERYQKEKSPADGV